MAALLNPKSPHLNALRVKYITHLKVMSTVGNTMYRTKYK